MRPLKVNSNDTELSTSEIFELKNTHVIFTAGLLHCKNEDTGKEFTISEDGYNILRKNKGARITIINR